ncbi:MAG: tail fiber domain-containing protein [Kiloniellales bacterium]|nr:tail fiber domain-containing protein [Kiloniellales bacterium]
MIRNLAAAGLLFLAAGSERAQAQIIDCDNPATSPTALQDAIHSGFYLIEFTGTCDEFVWIYRDDVHLRGTNMDPNLNVINGEVSVSVAQDIKLDNLRIQGDGLFITNEAFVRMWDMVVEDTDFGVFIARNSGAIMDNVTIGPALIDDGSQSCTPFCIGENSYVRMFNSTVNGATNDVRNGGAVVVYRGSTLLLRGGNTITNSGDQPALAAFNNSLIRQDDPDNIGTGSIAALGTGLAVSAYRMSTFDTREAVITGDIEVGQHAFMNVSSDALFSGDPNLMTINGDIELSQDSALTVSSPLVTINGAITCADDESSAAGSFAGSGTNSCSGFDAEVVRDDGTAQFLVDENAVGTASRQLLRLENNGNPQIELTNAATGVNWRVGMGPANSFFAKKGSRELRFTQGGGLKVINSGNQVFNLLPNGNLVIDGNLTQLSDAGAKHDVTPLDEAEVLAQVASLPVSAWSYKDDDTGARHAGPMAQDFHAAFGLGEDDTHISPMDAAGVALAAIKALQEESRQKDTQNEELMRQKDAEIATLRERLLTLEDLVAGLRGDRKMVTDLTDHR